VIAYILVGCVLVLAIVAAWDYAERHWL